MTIWKEITRILLNLIILGVHFWNVDRFLKNYLIFTPMSITFMKIQKMVRIILISTFYILSPSILCQNSLVKSLLWLTDSEFQCRKRLQLYTFLYFQKAKNLMYVTFVHLNVVNYDSLRCTTFLNISILCTKSTLKTALQIIQKLKPHPKIFKKNL